MNRFLSLAVLPLFASCATPVLETHPWEIEATAGANEATNNTHGTSHAEPQAGIIAAYRVSPVVELGAQLATSGVKVDGSVTDGLSTFDLELKFRDYSLGPILRLNVPTGTGIVPFGELGAGFGMVDVTGSVNAGNLGSVSESDNKTEVWYQAGAGARFYVSETTALVILGRYRWQDIEDFDKTVESWQAAAGVSFSF